MIFTHATFPDDEKEKGGGIPDDTLAELDDELDDEDDFEDGEEEEEDVAFDRHDDIDEF
jgi:hypothetical protein